MSGFVRRAGNAAAHTRLGAIAQRGVKRAVRDDIARLEALLTEQQRQLSRTEAFLRDAAEHLRERVESLSVDLSTIRAELTSPPGLAHPELFTFIGEDGREIMGYEPGNAPHDDSSITESFCAHFRGSEDAIRDAQSRYVEIVSGHQPVLDIGSGRGEFLDACAATKVTASGIDLDEKLVANCKSRGLNVTHGDGLEYLEATPDDSLGSLFSAQVIEHLSHEQLEAYFRLGIQKLKPGGVLIAETVNPHSIAAFKMFWLDTTHVHPIYPEVAIVYARAAGFETASIVWVGESGGLENDRRSCVAYAVVALKSSSTK